MKSNKNAAAAASAAMAYELVQTKQALQAVKALHQLESPSSDDSSVDIEPLAQDQELLNSMDHGSLAAAVQSYATIPLDLTTQQHQALISGYKDGIQLFSGHGGATAGISAGNSEALAAFGHQLLLPGPFCKLIKLFSSN